MVQKSIKVGKDLGKEAQIPKLNLFVLARPKT